MRFPRRIAIIGLVPTYMTVTFEFNSFIIVQVVSIIVPKRRGAIPSSCAIPYSVLCPGVSLTKVDLVITLGFQEFCTVCHDLTVLVCTKYWSENCVTLRALQSEAGPLWKIAH